MSNLELSFVDFKKVNHYLYSIEDNSSDRMAQVLGYIFFPGMNISGLIIFGGGIHVLISKNIHPNHKREIIRLLKSGDGIINYGQSGASLWNERISDEDRTIFCKRLEGGGIICGLLKEESLGSEEQSKSVQVSPS